MGIKNKDYSLSFIRFCATTMIIFCHTFEWIGFTLGYSNSLGIAGNFLAAGVQLFLILSGYLYGKRILFESESRIEFVFRNFKKILLDYYIYLFLVIIPVYCFRRPESINPASIFDFITCSGQVEGVHHLWYIPYILFVYLTTPLLYDLKKYILKESGGILPVLLTMSGMMAVTEIIGRAYESYFVPAWINCYIVGFFLPDLRKKIKLNIQGIIAVILTGISSLINYFKLHIEYEILPQFTSGIENELCHYYINYSRIIFALNIFLVIILMGECFSWKKRILYKILDFSDKYSYDIYIVHMIYVKGIVSLLDLTDFYLVNVCIMLLVTIISAIVLNVICDVVRKFFVIMCVRGGGKMEY